MTILFDPQNCIKTSWHSFFYAILHYFKLNFRIAPKKSEAIKERNLDLYGLKERLNCPDLADTVNQNLNLTTLWPDNWAFPAVFSSQ